MKGRDGPRRSPPAPRSGGCVQKLMTVDGFCTHRPICGRRARAARQGGVVSTAQLHAAGLGARSDPTPGARRPADPAPPWRLCGRSRAAHADAAGGGRRSWRAAAPARAALSHGSAAAVWDLLPSPAKFDVTTLRTRPHPRRPSASTAAEPCTPPTSPTTTACPSRPSPAPSSTSPPRSPPTASSASSTEPSTSASSTHTPSMSSWQEPKAAARTPSRASHRAPGNQRPRHHPQRPRGAVPHPHPQCAVPAATGQRHGRSLRRRLPLARPPPHRRDGRSRHARHTNRFHADRRRDAELAARGFRVLRFTWRQVLYEPHSVLRAMRG